MCDEGESQQELPQRFEGSLVGPSIRPVPFTSADGSEGADLFLAPEAFREAFAADVDQATADLWPLRNGRTPPPRSPARRRARRRGRHCRAGTCSAPKTRRSHRRSNDSWPSARTRRSWRYRPPTSRSFRSPTPRPSSSFRQSRGPCPRLVAPSPTHVTPRLALGRPSTARRTEQRTRRPLSRDEADGGILDSCGPITEVPGRSPECRSPRNPGLSTDHRRGACQTESGALRGRSRVRCRMPAGHPREASNVVASARDRGV